MKSVQLDQLESWILREHANTVDLDRLVALRQIITDLSGRAPFGGAVVEVGCHKGAMAVWMRAVLDGLDREDLHMYVFDSFEGMPRPSDFDSDHLAAGDLVASPEDVVENHARWGLMPPTIVKGWFEDTLSRSLPDGIVLCYADGDFYESTLVTLQEVIPRLAFDGVIVIDDYADLDLNPRAFAGLPGVKLACEEYFGGAHPLEVLVGAGDLAFGVYKKKA